MSGIKEYKASQKWKIYFTNLLEMLDKALDPDQYIEKNCQFLIYEYLNDEKLLNHIYHHYPTLETIWLGFNSNYYFQFTHTIKRKNNEHLIKVAFARNSKIISLTNQFPMLKNPHYGNFGFLVRGYDYNWNSHLNKKEKNYFFSGFIWLRVKKISPSSEIYLFQAVENGLESSSINDVIQEWIDKIGFFLFTNTNLLSNTRDFYYFDHVRNRKSEIFHNTAFCSVLIK